MKKTFAILSVLAFAGAGFASATDLDDAVVGFTDFSSPYDSYTTSLEGVTFSVTTGEDVTTLTATQTGVFSTVESRRTYSSLTLVLNTGNLTAPSSGVTSIVEDNNATYGWGLGLNDSGSLVLLWQGGARDLVVSNSVLGSGVITVTLATGDDGTDLYINGVSAGNDSDLKFNYSINALEFSNSTLPAVEQLYAFSSTLSAADAAAISKAVPEPATATLGLLALAGLAARRRRK